MIRKAAALFAVLLISGIFIEGGNFVMNDEKVSNGFNGISWTEVIPIKKVAFVGFDEESYLDDYAYLAAIPATTFYKDDKLYSYPLLFYEEREINDKKELTLNANQGIKYFMEDWLSYCNNVEIELINAENAKKWDARYSYINSSSIYDVAAKIATKHWMNSKECMITIAGDFYNEKKIGGEMSTEMSDALTESFSISLPEPEGIGGVYKSFEIKEPYKYIEVKVEWNPLLRGKDIDLQLYDDAIGMVDASENWNALAGTYESVESYIFNYGTWEVGLTNMPTEAIMEDMAAKMFKAGNREYEAEIYLYPGKIIDLPVVNFLAKNVSINIECNKNISFGALLLSERNIAYEAFKGKGQLKMSFDEIGGGNYSICIFVMEDSSNLQFKIYYEWNEVDRQQIDSFAFASQAAIMASLMDIPLLYVAPDDIPDETKNAIEELGIEKVYVVGNYPHQLEEIAEIQHYSLQDAYEKIYEITGGNDVVFSSASPWSYWLAEELRQKGEKEKALYIAPAAYAALHHGCPLFIVEEHKELSEAASWVTDFWKRDSRARQPPSVACMYLMAKQVYDFLIALGIDKEGKEDILTVAGQFDIGIGWDRAFVGKANPGRILGTPVDTAYWICRSIFYPALIFQNPALREEGITLINGSKSRRDALGRLHIIKPSMEEHFYYPVLQTWVSYCHEFNKEASKYWGCKYTTRDGITPYETPSPYRIDEGVTDKVGAYWPDMSTSEVVPFYLKKLGYANVFSTNFTATMDNLNRGAIMWFEGMHASHANSGVVGFWDPDANWTKMFYYFKDFPLIGNVLKNKKINTEPNPWRGYEFGLWRQAFFRWGIGGKSTQIFQTGSTEDPDVIVMDKYIGWDWRAGMYGDGVVIAILQQVATEIKTGYDIDAALQNLHSCGINAGISCYIAATYLHIALIRHGSVFQIIDPWLTSWYCNFAVEMFARYLAMGYTAGEAYEKAISHVGIEYLTGKWWWDICENVCYFGDPSLRVWSPVYSWEEPYAIEPGAIGGHII